MKEKIPTLLGKIKSEFILFKLLVYLIIFNFSPLFSFSFAQNEIHLIVKGTGNHSFLNELFYKDPSNIIINGNEIESKMRWYDFQYELNNVTIKFDSLLNSCEKMFYELTNIIEIDLSKLNTSNTTTMDCMFLECEDLETVIFGNIETSLVNNMDSLFRNCSKLKSLDLSNFDFSLVTNMYGAFSHCESLTSIKLTKFNALNVENMYDLFAHCYKLTSIDLSTFDISRVTNTQGMFYHCEALKYLDLSNFKPSSVTNMKYMFQFCYSLIYINLFSLKIQNSTNITNIFGSTPSILKICNNNPETVNLLQLQGAQIQNFNCSDICFMKNITLDLLQNIYLEYWNPHENKKYRYKYYCYEKCPNTTYVSKNNEYECLDKTQNGIYYFDVNKGIYKECYSNCKKCEDGGNDINNNCTECKANFIFLNETDYKSNCYKKCQYYYYFDEFNNYKCTENKQCPEKYNILIQEKNKCIDECEKDNIFRYEYNNTCIEKCPKYTKELNYKCLNDEILENDKYIEVFQDYIVYTDIPKNVAENKKDYIMEKNNVLYQITTTENQKNNIYSNISTISLGNCETILRKNYDIDKTLPLTILKIDYKIPGLLVPIIGYEVYHPINKTKLDLTSCKDVKLNIPVDIDENKLFLYDTKSEFYNDDCSAYTNENGTDILPNDRKQEFKDKNLSLCENNCEYIGYDFHYKQSSCECVIKNKMDSISEIINNPNKLANDFQNNESDSNFLSSSAETMKCTSTLFSKEGLISNIASYIIFIIILHLSLSILFFIKCGYSLIEEDISEILDSKKEEEEKKNQNLQNTPIKKKSLKKNIQNFPPKKTRQSHSNLKFKKKSGRNSNNMDIFIGFNDKSTKENIIIKVKEKDNGLIVNTTNTLNDYELNTFIFEKAISFDKRSWSEYYLSLLKTKHPLIFSFVSIKDYNNMIIKSCIFSLSFSIYYSINFAFFNYNVIHKLYKEGGKYDVVYFLPKIIISFFVSHIIYIIIKLIFLSERNIMKIKNQASFSEAQHLASKVKITLIIKYIIFFILGIAIQIFFWMLLSSFGAVFKNTQIRVFENTLISIGISFIYPFFINIFPCIIRICSISSKSEILYNFSKFLQIL